MNGVDVIAFTAGLGENAAAIREGVCEGLEYLGVEFDKEANNCRGVERVLTKESSKVTVVSIPTNEELAICRETVGLVK